MKIMILENSIWGKSYYLCCTQKEFDGFINYINLIGDEDYLKDWHHFWQNADGMCYKENMCAFFLDYYRPDELTPEIQQHWHFLAQQYINLFNGEKNETSKV